MIIPFAFFNNAFALQATAPSPRRSEPLSKLLINHYLSGSHNHARSSILTSQDSHIERNTTHMPEALKILVLPLINRVNHYALQIAIGEPPQPVEFPLDTASSDFYHLDSPAAMCCDSTLDLSHSRIFNSTKSHTLIKRPLPYKFEFAQDWNVRGTWVQDSINVGNIVIQNFTFVLAESATLVKALGGIGLAINEASNHQYPNLPMALKENGHTLYIAYSLWLNSQSETQGSIIFGGLDKSKLDSDIYLFPVLPWLTNNVDTFAIKLDGIALEYPGGSRIQRVYCSVPIVVDAGVTLSRLPEELLGPFYQTLGIDIKGQSPTLPCEQLAHGGGFSLNLSGVEFFFSFHDIAVRVENDEGFMCVPGFIPSKIPVLGTNFMSSLYVVFDLEKKEIGLALARTKSYPDIIGIPEYVEISTGIPGVKAPHYSRTQFDSVFDKGIGKFLANPTIATPTLVPAAEIHLGKNDKVGLISFLGAFNLENAPKPPESSYM